MSSMIQCDGCKKLMYSDSRSEKGDYHEIWIDRQRNYHLCKICYDGTMRNLFHMRWCEDEQQYIEDGGDSE